MRRSSRLSKKPVVSYVYDYDGSEDDSTGDDIGSPIKEYKKANSVYDDDDDEDYQYIDEEDQGDDYEDEDDYMSDSIVRNQKSSDGSSNIQSDTSWVDDGEDISDEAEDMDTDIKESDIEELMSDAKAFLSRPISAQKTNRHYLINKAEFIGYYLSKTIQQRVKSSQLTIEDACINSPTHTPYVILSFKKASKTIAIHTKLNFDEVCMGVVLAKDEIHDTNPVIDNIDDFLGCRVESAIIKNGIEQRSFSRVSELIGYLTNPNDFVSHSHSA